MAKIFHIICFLGIIFNISCHNQSLKNTLFIHSIEIRNYTQKEDLNSKTKILLQLNHTLNKDLPIAVFKNDIFSNSYYDSIRSNFLYLIIGKDTCKLILRENKVVGKLYFEIKFPYDYTGTNIASSLNLCDYFITKKEFKVMNYESKKKTNILKSNNFKPVIFIDDKQKSNLDSNLLNKRFIKLPHT